jgi:dephospho-CoA kinase
MLRVALTGGIATGKSHCLRAFAALGVPVLDADALAREAVRPGSAGLAAVGRRFGPDVLAADGTVDRSALARLVFSDEAARRDLEAIIHPFVYTAIDDWFRTIARISPAAAGGAAFGIADVPLLYESGGAARFDRVVLAACRVDQQIARLRARDGLSEEEARQRIAAQWPIDTKRGLTDLVIDTSGSPAETTSQVEAMYRQLEQEARPGASPIST